MSDGVSHLYKDFGELGYVPSSLFYAVFVTFYAARHTWASLARKAGVEKATIDECLCHKGDFTLTDIYAERSWDLMTEANRKVLQLFSW